MNILISGASGFIGRHLSNFLSGQGYKVFSLQRKEPSNPPYWNIDKNVVDLGKCNQIDVVIHLAGENIASGRWTKKKKEKIESSRIKGTKLLCEYVSSLKNKPKLLISASAIGFYGDRGEETLTEDSPKGTGFLADVCKKWEKETRIALNSGIRVVNMRFGMVLSPYCGALKKMLIPFRLGLGGVIGTGKQYISWISIEDVLGAIYHIIKDENMIGPINFVSPNPVTNRYFTKTLAQILHRPALIPLPSLMVQVLLGEMANELLLSSTKVIPKKLIYSGYSFRYSSLESTFKTYFK